MASPRTCSFFFFNDTATTEIYTLSLHDALPISFESISRRHQLPAVPRSALHGRLPRRLDSKAEFARGHHRGLVHRLRPLRAELSLRQHQFASIRSHD